MYTLHIRGVNNPKTLLSIYDTRKYLYLPVNISYRVGPAHMTSCILSLVGSLISFANFATVDTVVCCL